MEPARLRLEPVATEGDDLVLAARLERPNVESLRLWWRLPAAWAEAITPWADPFVVGFLFPMMQAGGRVRVEGRVSPSLMANLETFMAIWHTWVPDVYRPADIRAAEEVEAPLPPEPGHTVLSFSCGLDSCFTLLRHRRGLVGRRNRDIRAAVVMNGFDIRLDQPNAAAMYAGLLESARVLLDSQGVACIPMSSNFHDLPTIWGDSFVTHLSSGLRLLGGRFDSMLVANDTEYDHLSGVSGGHPACTPHMDSLAFKVIDDGGECRRAQKVRLVAEWPEAMQHLRVCFSNPGSHRNCCRCQKCLRTALLFLAAGLPIPSAFGVPIAARDIRRARFSGGKIKFWRDLLTAADGGGAGRTWWARAARAAIRRNRRRDFLNRFKRRLIPLRNLLRRAFRGSALSRRELAQRATDGAARRPAPPPKGRRP